MRAAAAAAGAAAASIAFLPIARLPAAAAALAPSAGASPFAPRRGVGVGGVGPPPTAPSAGDVEAGLAGIDAVLTDIEAALAAGRAAWLSGPGGGSGGGAEALAAAAPAPAEAGAEADPSAPARWRAEGAAWTAAATPGPAAAVDPGFGVAGGALLISPGGHGPLEAHLECVDPAVNSDKFYSIQAIGNGTGAFVCARWGRRGTRGRRKVDGPMDPEAAAERFEGKFRAKTGLSFADREAEPLEGRYRAVRGRPREAGGGAGGGGGGVRGGGVRGGGVRGGGVRGGGVRGAAAAVVVDRKELFQRSLLAARLAMEARCRARIAAAEAEAEARRGLGGEESAAVAAFSPPASSTPEAANRRIDAWIDAEAEAHRRRPDAARTSAAMSARVAREAALVRDLAREARRERRAREEGGARRRGAAMGVLGLYEGQLKPPPPPPAGRTVDLRYLSRRRGRRSHPSPPDVGADLGVPTEAGGATNGGLQPMPRSAGGAGTDDGGGPISDRDAIGGGGGGDPPPAAVDFLDAIAAAAGDGPTSDRSVVGPDVDPLPPAVDFLDTIAAAADGEGGEGGGVDTSDPAAAVAAVPGSRPREIAAGVRGGRWGRATSVLGLSPRRRRRMALLAAAALVIGRRLLVTLWGGRLAL